MRICRSTRSSSTWRRASCVWNAAAPSINDDAKNAADATSRAVRRRRGHDGQLRSGATETPAVDRTIGRASTPPSECTRFANDPESLGAKGRCHCSAHRARAAACRRSLDDSEARTRGATVVGLLFRRWCAGDSADDAHGLHRVADARKFWRALAPPVTANRMRSLTMRSSPEWYDRTATRPPFPVRRIAASSAGARASSSPLTSILMAWKVRFAGCPPVRRAAAGIAATTTAASSVVVSIGRDATIALEIRRANRSSPYCWSTRASWSTGYPLTTSAAVQACERSMRISSGASLRYEKPRAPSSSAGELTAENRTTLPERAVDRESFHGVFQAVESTVVNHQPISETGEPLTSGGECDLDRDPIREPQAVRSSSSNNSACPPPRAWRRARRPRAPSGEHFRDLVGHHRKMKELFAHSHTILMSFAHLQPPVHRCRRDVSPVKRDGSGRSRGCPSCRPEDCR
jgi:hypothetical protein